MKDLLKNYGSEFKAKLCEISDFIYENPELGNQEFKAVETLTSFLSENNFIVEKNIAGMETSFKAVFDSKKKGPTIGYLCEYDALPEIGHGCGHNMIGAMSAGAGVILSKVLNDIGGKIIVYGTPAEETNGGKVILAESGEFNELDAAMIVHPDGQTRASGSSTALYPIRFTYTGKTAHAASCPEKGINALNAVIQLFTGIDALRQHVTPDVRIHGIITKGGVAANIVPGEAVAEFYVRASKKEIMEDVLEKVKSIAQGAALMTGATLEMDRYELPYDDLKTNEALSNLFNDNLKELGITEFLPAKSGGGSSDIGNVSYIAPTIHPYLGITDAPIVGHSVDMACATQTAKAHDRLLIGALAMAYTGYDIISNNINLK